MFEKKKTVTETPTAESPVTLVSTLTHVALGIARDAKSNEWCVVEIEFNPETGETGTFKFVPAGSSKEMASEQFKITAVNKELV
jgi:hypothetical protein